MTNFLHCLTGITLGLAIASTAIPQGLLFWLAILLFAASGAWLTYLIYIAIGGKD